MSAIADRVRRAREAQALTQQQLFDMSGVGLRTIKDIEQGQSNAKVLTLYFIAKALKVPVDELLPGPNLEGDPDIERQLLKSYFRLSEPGRAALLEIGQQLFQLERNLHKEGDA